MGKLRMHHDLTLDIMEKLTLSLGESLRKFSQTTCAAFKTKELSREYDSRVRRQGKRAQALHLNAQGATSASGSQGQHASEDPVDAGPPLATPAATQPQPEAGCHAKALNLNTYKCHSLGDYVHAIRQYGTTDSYSTEPVSVPYLFLPAMPMSFSRENLNIAHQSLGIPEQIAKAFSSR